MACRSQSPFSYNMKWNYLLKVFSFCCPKDFLSEIIRIQVKAIEAFEISPIIFSYVSIFDKATLMQFITDFECSWKICTIIFPENERFSLYSNQQIKYNIFWIVVMKKRWRIFYKNVYEVVKMYYIISEEIIISFIIKKG